VWLVRLIERKGETLLAHGTMAADFRRSRRSGAPTSSPTCASSCGVDVWLVGENAEVVEMKAPLPDLELTTLR
jgi:hypothetical protein